MGRTNGVCAMSFVGACFDGVVGLGESVVEFGSARHGVLFCGLCGDRFVVEGVFVELSIDCEM